MQTFVFILPITFLWILLFLEVQGLKTLQYRIAQSSAAVVSQICLTNAELMNVIVFGIRLWNVWRQSGLELAKNKVMLIALTKNNKGAEVFTLIENLFKHIDRCF